MCLQLSFRMDVFLVYQNIIDLHRIQISESGFKRVIEEWERMEGKLCENRESDSFNYNPRIILQWITAFPSYTDTRKPLDKCLIHHYMIEMHPFP